MCRLHCDFVSTERIAFFCVGHNIDVAIDPSRTAAPRDSLAPGTRPLPGDLAGLVPEP
jgi:hypothetical protein